LIGSGDGNQQLMQIANKDEHGVCMKLHPAQAFVCLKSHATAISPLVSPIVEF
jgi:hypothetical protein